MEKVTYENGVATFNTATQKQLAKAAAAVNRDVEGFIEHSLVEAMRAAIESEMDERNAKVKEAA